MALTTENLMAYLRDELGVDASDIEPAALLFSSGLIDSYALVQLITHIENECGFRVEAGDVTLDNFDSVERILAYVERATD